MRVIVYGGRTWRDVKGRLAQYLNRLHDNYGSTLIVIEGGAEGADREARLWCRKHGVHCATVEATWDVNGASAGPLRNMAMASLQPQLGIECTGGHGTASMRRLLIRDVVPIHFIDEEPT
jgi:hypothetical protein